MAGSTKLFQRAGSPLIQGHSKTARSFWAQWWTAFAAAVLIVYGFLAGATLLDPTRPSFSSFASVGQWLLLGVGGIVAAIPACALGVSLARSMGWRRVWLVGALSGGALGVIVMFWTRPLL